MAEVKVIHRDEVVLVPQTKQVKRIILDLSEEEAYALKEIFRWVGGDPEKSDRKHINSINTALIDARVYRGLSKTELQPGGIYFKDN